MTETEQPPSHGTPDKHVSLESSDSDTAVTSKVPEPIADPSRQAKTTQRSKYHVV